MRVRLLLFVGATSLLCLLILMQHSSNVGAQGAIIWSADHEEVGLAEAGQRPGLRAHVADLEGPRAAPSRRRARRWWSARS